MNMLDLAGGTEKREAAFELKLVVPEPIAEAALIWARAHLVPDPHGDGAAGDGYRVNSLYFDTPRLDVYQRKGSYGKSKYRVRRYGSESNVFVERKLKSRGLVSKRRTRIPDEDARWLALEPDPAWPGYWFCRRLNARQLQPQCQIRYDRVARVGMSPDGPVRFTVDRNICSFLSKDYGVVESGDWLPVLSNQCIVELKFRREMPTAFKEFLEELKLTPQPVSKYRLSIQAFGLAPEGQAADQNTPRNGHASANALLGNNDPLRSSNSALPLEA